MSLNDAQAHATMADYADAERSTAKANNDHVAELKARRMAKIQRTMQLVNLPFGLLAAIPYAGYCYTQGYFDEIPESNV